MCYDYVQDVDVEYDIDDLVDALIADMNEYPRKYVSLADHTACPYCYSLFGDEVGFPEKDVIKCKCITCKATFYKDFRR